MIGERLAETGGGLVVETRYHVRFDAPGDPSQGNGGVLRIDRREPVCAPFWRKQRPDRDPSGGFVWEMWRLRVDLTAPLRGWRI